MCQALRPEMPKRAVAMDTEYFNSGAWTAVALSPISLPKLSSMDFIVSRTRARSLGARGEWECSFRCFHTTISFQVGCESLALKNIPPRTDHHINTQAITASATFGSGREMRGKERQRLAYILQKRDICSQWLSV